MCSLFLELLKTIKFVLETFNDNLLAINQLFTFSNSFDISLTVELKLASTN